MGPQFFETPMGQKFFNGTMLAIAESLDLQVKATMQLVAAVKENNQILKASLEKGEPKKTGFVIVFTRYGESERTSDCYWQASDKQMQTDLQQATIYSTHDAAAKAFSEILEVIGSKDLEDSQLNFPEVRYLMNGKLFFVPEEA